MTHLNDTSLTTRRIVLCIIIVPAIVVGVLSRAARESWSTAKCCWWDVREDLEDFGRYWRGEKP